MTHSHDTSTPAMSAETVPSEEFVLVPREPTPAMQRAYFDSIDTNMHRVENDVRFGRYENMRTAYRAMLDAAPAPNPSPAAKGGEAAPRLASELATLVQSADYRLEVPDRYSVSLANANRMVDLARHLTTALATPSSQPAHSDDLAVDRFAVAMKAKLADARAKGNGGWSDDTECSQQYLSDELRRHALKPDPLDVANFAMFLHQRNEPIATPSPQPADAVQEALLGLNKRIKGLQRRSFILTPEGNGVRAVRDGSGAWLNFYEVMGLFSDETEYTALAPDPAPAGEAVDGFVYRDETGMPQPQKLPAPEDTARLREELERRIAVLEKLYGDASQHAHDQEQLVSSLKRERDDARKALGAATDDRERLVEALREANDTLAELIDQPTMQYADQSVLANCARKAVLRARAALATEASR